MKIEKDKWEYPMPRIGKLLSVTVQHGGHHTYKGLFVTEETMDALLRRHGEDVAYRIKGTPMHFCYNARSCLLTCFPDPIEDMSIHILYCASLSEMHNVEVL